MTNKLAILVGSVSLVIIAALLFHGHGVKSELHEAKEDFADEKLRSKRAQRQNLDYESRIRDLEVALRQKTEQQSNVQAELDEAEQQVQEGTEFVKEVQASLDEMATQFGIALEAGETVATTAIRTLTERVGEQMKALKTEVESLQQKVSGHEANAGAIVESKEALKKELDEALAKVAANTKELTTLRNDYKKINAVVQALLLSENASTADLQKQAEEVAKKAAELDKKIAAAATKPAAQTAAPTTKPEEKEEEEKEEKEENEENEEYEENKEQENKENKDNEENPENAEANHDNDHAGDTETDDAVANGDDTAVKADDNTAPDGHGSSGNPAPKKGKEEEYDT